MLEVNYWELGTRIRQKRESIDWTQSDLARRIGVSGSFIGHIERAEKAPSLETVGKICVALDTSMDWLVFRLKRRCDGNTCPLYNDLSGLMKAYGLGKGKMGQYGEL